MVRYDGPAVSGRMPIKDGVDMLGTPESAAIEADRRAARIGWLLWSAAVIPTTIGVLLIVATNDLPLPAAYGFRGFPALFALAFGSVGAVIVARRPGHRVGVVFAAAGIMAALQTLAQSYAAVGLLARWPVPGSVWGAWVNGWIWVPFTFLAGPVLIAVFPDGHFMSVRWRRVILLGALGTVAGILGLALQDGPIEGFAFVSNPIGVLSREAADAGSAAFGAAFLLGLVLASLSLVRRFRQAPRDERQQMKWVASAGALMAIAAPLGLVSGKVGEIAFILSICAIPVAAGVAILRYGLYEIDTIINRALVYGLLTAILAGLYAATVGVIQRLLEGLVGRASDAGVITTTLLVVSAFTPVRARLQRLVDRRFQDGREPAAKVAAFATTIAERVWPIDSDRLLDRFAAVVGEAYGAAGVHVRLERPETPQSMGFMGRTDGVSSLTVSGTNGGATVRLTMFDSRPMPRQRPAADRVALADAAERLAAELAGVSRG